MQSLDRLGEVYFSVSHVEAPLYVKAVSFGFALFCTLFDFLAEIAQNIIDRW